MLTKKYTIEETNSINTKYKEIIIMNVEQSMEALKNCQNEQNTHIQLIEKDISYIKCSIDNLTKKFTEDEKTFVSKEDYDKLVNRLWALGVLGLTSLGSSVFAIIHSFIFDR